MKKFFFLLAAVACLGFTACTDEKEDAANGGSIVGTWTLSEWEDSENYFIWVLTFTENGSFAEVESECWDGEEYEDVYTGEYTYSGTTLVLNYDDGDVWETNAKVSGNKLTIWEGDDSVEFERSVE